jgi:TPR repeat protein
VPLSDDEKEEVLDRARPLVLKSSDPEMQLAWAQDALSWVDVAHQSYSRQQQSDGQPPRSITPKVEHALRVDAISIVTFLAEQHHPKAEFMKGTWLEFGKFEYRVDKKEAFLAYKRAAERSYARAEYRIGMQYESSNNSLKAIEHYKKGVAMKDSASNYRLGMMTLLGQHDTPQDYQRGVDLIRYAADTADENAPQGAYVYGMLLARELPNISIPDHFLPYDLNDAKMFIEKAAYLGFAKAQVKMAQAYELCQLGCDFDPALSLHYNALASRQGEAEADMAISKWFLCGFEGVFEKNEELAFTYAKRAAHSKMATAEFAMGYFYEIGMYVEINLAESEAWYRKAADHGNKDAIGRIDSIKKNNTLSKKDHEQVAISRIKSQYGSQRGVRPDRFKKRASPMAPMHEDRVDMPDPRNSYAGSGTPQLRIQSTSNPPPRPVSTAPYPEDDDVVSPGLGVRSSYYNKGQGLRPTSAAGPQADRPSSAFGIRPLHHSATESYGHQPYSAEPQRPSSSMGNDSLPNGRGSNPAGRDRVVSVGWEPQVPAKYREPSPNRQPTIPQIAPLQPAKFDQGSNRLQKQRSPNTEKPQPQPPPQFPIQPYPSEPPRKPISQIRTDSPSIPRRDPAMNQFQRPERGSSMTPVTPIMSPPLQRHERFDSLHNQGQSPVSSVGPSRASQRPPQQTMSSQRPETSHSPSASSTMAPPKKTGPATFEEMGIPAGKNDSECVSFLGLSVWGPY